MAATEQIPPEQLAKLAGEDLGPLTKNIVIAFTVIALVSVSLRIYTRFRYKAVGWEDYSIIIATVCQSHIVHASSADQVCTALITCDRNRSSAPSKCGQW